MQSRLSPDYLNFAFIAFITLCTRRLGGMHSSRLEALQESGNPVYDLVREYADVFPDKIPAELPANRGVRHEIDLVPGSNYCVTRQWTLHQDQVEATDAFFDGHRKRGHVRESLSPHSSRTFCVLREAGGYCMRLIR